MYLLGASGHARVIREIIESGGERVSAFIDDDMSKTEMDGLPVFHDTEGRNPLIVAIGDNRIRYKVVQRLKDLGITFGSAVHRQAIVSPTAEIGEGTVIMPGAIVNAYAKIGKHCIINTGAVVDHECVIGDFVDICPHTTLCGNVHVGDGSNVCAGSTVIQGINIGRWSMVGAGSVCRHDVGDGVVVVGNDCHEIKTVEIPE